MNLSRYRVFDTSQVEEIRRLRDELWHARYVIVHLMPEDVQALLLSFSACATPEETYRWADSVAMQIAAKAVPLPDYVGSMLGDRGGCPLCGDEGSSPYLRGFALPEGLRRHLLGVGNTRRCSVMEAAAQLAGDHWYEKFREAEAAEEAERQARTIQRRKSETQYRTDPNGKPKLIDEGISRWSKHRDDDRLKWAENRLGELGFTVTCEDNVKSYTSHHDTYVIYADPRVEGLIEFMVFRKTASGRVSKSRWGQRYGIFNLRDNWKHDLRGKYETRLAKALSILAGPG